MQASRPERAKALCFAWSFKAFALTGRQVCDRNYPGRCPGLGASALSGRVGQKQGLPYFCPFRACGAKVGIVLFLPFQSVWSKSRNCLISALLERAASWNFWAFSPYLSHMRKFSKAKVMRCFCRRETFQGYPSLLAMPIAHSGISFTYSLNILPSVILKRS